MFKMRRTGMMPFHQGIGNTFMPKTLYKQSVSQAAGTTAPPTLAEQIVTGLKKDKDFEQPDHHIMQHKKVVIKNDPIDYHDETGQEMAAHEARSHEVDRALRQHNLHAVVTPASHTLEEAETHIRYHTGGTVAAAAAASGIPANVANIVGGYAEWSNNFAGIRKSKRRR